jgi:AcrR family transcriptional regulator
MTDKRTIQTRNKILRAASQIVVDSGITQLTLENVAERAGISKGGLLYHFGTKEDLIKGMIDRALNHFEDRLNNKLSQNSNWLEAYIQASLERSSVEDQMSSGLLVAVALNPALLEPLQTRYLQWQQKLQDYTNNHEKAFAIRLILDGLWVSNLLNLAPLTEENIHLLGQYVFTLLKE